MPQPSALESVLDSVRKRIIRSQGKRLNEENTKATLIEPVLRALGWDVEDDEEVCREFRHNRRDKPVDYGLLSMRTPRLFVEAKAIGENLDDRRWSNQIMGYAGVAGVQWIVLTDGNEYRIYNTHAPVSVEEKLFRTVRVSEDSPILVETLELLAKDRIEENRIEQLWRAHYVDRQVKTALDQLFSGEGELLLVNYVAQRTKKLAEEDIRSSLARCRPSFDFPEPTEASIRKARKGGEEKPKKPRASGERSEVTLLDLIRVGLIDAPVELQRAYKGKQLRARIEADGRVSFQGQTVDSISMAGAIARASVIGKGPKGTLPATNGWTFWKLTDSSGKTREVAEVRAVYAAGSKGRPGAKGKAV